MVPPPKIAFITGITGQDGAYLAQFLLDKGYAVHGLIRWDCVDTTARLQALEIDEDRLSLYYGDLNDANNITYLIKTIAPDEIYNLAALSHVKVSFDTPRSALDINAGGTLHILEAVRILGMEARVRIYQASSSEMFGSAPAPQNEETPMQPCSPYGVAKLAAFHLSKIYREAYGMHVSNGILFNHESPLRGKDFVTRKIAQAVARIESGTQKILTLGNLDSVRDWGHARDYIRGMWIMLQQPAGGDYVLATGQAHTVREFTQRAFEQIGVSLVWQGTGIEEQGLCAKSDKVLVSVDPALYRLKEVDYLLGDATKAAQTLGWKPEVFFEDLVADMVNAERKSLWQGESQWTKTG